MNNLHKLLESPNDWILSRDGYPSDLTKFGDNLKIIKQIIQNSSDNRHEKEHHLSNIQTLSKFIDLSISITRKYIFGSRLKMTKNRTLQHNISTADPTIIRVERAFKILKRVDLDIVKELLPASLIQFNSIDKIFDNELWENSLSKLSGEKLIEILYFFDGFANDVFDDIKKCDFSLMYDMKYSEVEEKESALKSIEYLLINANTVAHEDDEFLQTTYLDHLLDEIDECFKNNRTIINSLINDFSYIIKTDVVQVPISEDKIKKNIFKFFEEGFLFDSDAIRDVFFNEFFSNIENWFMQINSCIELYTFSNLFYPTVIKGGCKPTDKISNDDRLVGGIEWKSSPANIDEVVKMLVDQNPSHLERLLNSCNLDNVSSSKIYKHTAIITKKYPWLESFINKHWPKLAVDRYKAKLNSLKKH